MNTKHSSSYPWLQRGRRVINTCSAFDSFNYVKSLRSFARNIVFVCGPWGKNISLRKELIKLVLI